MNIESSIFREYDIRGTYPEQINESSIKSIAFAIAKRCKKDNISTLVVGRDGRISGPALLEAFCEGLIESGINVDNIGLVTSPLLYFAAKKSKSKSGIMITGSHNPKNYNGIKMVINDSPISGTEIYTLISHEKNTNLEKGEIKYSDIKPIYLEEVCKNISIKNSEKIKVVLDCGNGAAGCIAPDLFKKLGLDVIELFSDVDGNFPNHHPDPGKLENLQDLMNEVKDNNADIGFAFDGDGDRVGLVTNNGDSVFPDKLMMLFSKDILSRDKGSIVFDVKCSNQLENIIRENGGDPIMSPTGHFHIKKSIKKHNSLLGGEMSGHIFFNDKWYGFDDGHYAAARATEILSNHDENISDIIHKFPISSSTPELNITVTDETKFTIVEKFTNECSLDGKKITIDGLRINFNNGWGLIRASNTTPKLVMRFEGNSLKDMNEIKDLFLSELTRICPDIVINLD
ncbi:phosphomannomutase/phosphoglucomutase [Gammaproteobacteria bacterium]|nr:phosphomannomutase/phosphoglucomutase [Gammaproteobacteria bacterium]MDA8908410.1 phosphomannomutase/phosphoglucomutase [Gammaproteobacteria bacterium]MDA8916126.1 phosphomannomutase/phosphoglucomutase [Gammaproteobacteria bacterium]MDB3915498.1 phosphomannomutase/phosphoglucomutase [Gammaproteobacteria bacterium]MDB9974022.1 phosphomannomutase/phosphoglucomutase [Gammaproteobacteria bacterium]